MITGAVSTNKYDGKVGLTCTWSAEQNAADNLSVISWKLESDGSADFEYYTGNVSLSIGGIVVLSIAPRFLMQGGGRWSRTGTVNIPHEPDGSKSLTVRIEAGIYAYGTVNCTGSETFELDTIPRASTAVVPDFMIGTPGSIAIQPAADGCTHNLSVVWKDTYQIAEGVGTVYQWTPKLAEWASRITDTAAAACEMVVDTMRDGVLLGSARYPFTLRVPDSVVPIVRSFVTSVSAPLDWDVPVRGYSDIRWTAEAYDLYGAEIVRVAFTAGDIRGDALTGSATLNTAGTITPTLTVTDSRGRSITETVSETDVYDYATPTITGADAYRCDSSGNAVDGTYIRVHLTPIIASVGGRNSAQAQYRINGGNWQNFDGDEILAGYATDRSYTVGMRVVDALGNASPEVIDTVSTGLAAFHLKNGGNAGAFGKYAETDGMLDVAWDLRVRGRVQLDQPCFVAENGETEWLFPPMEIGTEYRTTERFAGKPVYRKLIEHQFSSALSGSQDITIPHGITGLDMALSAKVITQGYVFPYVTTNTSLCVTCCDATNLTITNGNSSWANVSRLWYFDISYTKGG